MSAGITIREFARRDGCDDKLVRRALKTGHLQAFEDGTLDPDLVGTAWRKTNRRAADSADKTADILPQSADTANNAAAQVARQLLAGGVPYSQAEAERVKENYLALLRQLEYDIKSGAVVMVAEVAKMVGAEYARVRTRLLAIPAEQAPRLNRLKTVAEVEVALRGVIAEALEELTCDGTNANT